MNSNDEPRSYKISTSAVKQKDAAGAVLNPNRPKVGVCAAVRFALGGARAFDCALYA